ncbi:hypothetical protein Tco_1562704, partial [Tanacetum coccineum]
TPSDIQHSAATQNFGGVTIGTRDKSLLGTDEEISDGGIPSSYRIRIHPPVNHKTEDEREPMFIQAHDPDYVPEPIYPEYIPLEYEHELPVEDSHYSCRFAYVLSPRNDADDENWDDDRGRGGRGEDHLAPTRSLLLFQASISLPPEAEVERLLAMTTLSPSPPISLSPPSAGERLAKCTAPPAHSSPPPVPSPLLPSSGCPTQIQTLRIASTQALIDAVTAALPSPPLLLLPPSLYIPPPVDRRDDIPESEQPPRKRLCLSTLGSRYKIGESSTTRPTGDRGVDYGFFRTVDAKTRRQGISEVGYGIRDTWVDPTEVVPEIAPMTVGEVNTRVTKLGKLHEHDTQDLYALLEDVQDMWMVEEEAYASREAWAHSIGLSQATHQELQTHRDHVYAHETHIQAHQTQLQLQETDRRRQAQMAETLRVMRDMRREMSDMQAELLAHREQQRTTG